VTGNQNELSAHSLYNPHITLKWKTTHVLVQVASNLFLALPSSQSFPLAFKFILIVKVFYDPNPLPTGTQQLAPTGGSLF